MDDARSALRRASLNASHALYSSRRRTAEEQPTAEADEAYVKQLFNSNAFEQVCAHVDRLVNFNHSHVSKTILELRGRSLLRLSEYMLALEDFRQILVTMDDAHLEARAYYKVSAKMSARHCLLKARRLKEGLRTPLGQANPTAMDFPSTHSISETPAALSQKVLKLYTVGLGFAEQLLGGYICDFCTKPNIGAPRQANWGGTGYGQDLEGDVGESLSAGSAAPDEVWELILAARIGRAIELISLDRMPEATTELGIARQLAVHLEDGANGSEYNAASSAGRSPSVGNASLSSMGNFDSVQSMESPGHSGSPSLVSHQAFFEDSQEAGEENSKEQAPQSPPVTPLTSTPGPPLSRRSRVSSAIVALQPGEQPDDMISPGLLLRAHFDCLLVRADDLTAQGDLPKAGDMWAAAVGLLPKPMLAGATPRGLSAVAALQSSAETETLQQETDTDSTIDPVLKAMAYHNHGVSLMRSGSAGQASHMFASVLAILENRVGRLATLDVSSQGGKLAYKSMLCRGIALLAMGLGAAPLDPESDLSLDNVSGYVAKARQQLSAAEELQPGQDDILSYALGITCFCLGDESSAHKHLSTVMDSSAAASFPRDLHDSLRELREAAQKLIEANQADAAPGDETATPTGGEVTAVPADEQHAPLSKAEEPPVEATALA